MANDSYGIVIASHVPQLAQGLTKLLHEIAGDVSITYTGGTDDGDIGSSFEQIDQAIQDNEAHELFAFYDLGSAKMNLEMAIENTHKRIHLMDTAFVESAYTAAALIHGGSDFDKIMSQLEPLKVK